MAAEVVDSAVVGVGAEVDSVEEVGLVVAARDLGEARLAGVLVPAGGLSAVAAHDPVAGQ